MCEVNADMVLREKELYDCINAYIMELLPEAAKERVKNHKSILSGEFFRSGIMHYLAGMYVEACSNEDLSIEERIETLEVVCEALKEEINSNG